MVKFCFMDTFLELISWSWWEADMAKKKNSWLSPPASFFEASFFPPQIKTRFFLYFRFILAPFFWWSLSFPDILDFYKASKGGSYFSSLAFAICELCKRQVVPWALRYVHYRIDQKLSRYYWSARFRCYWFLDNKNSVIGELCAYHVGYHVGVFLRGTMVFICIVLKWKCNWNKQGSTKFDSTYLL